MSLCSWNDFLDEVMVDLPGCQTPVAVNAIKNAVEWLCKEAHVLVQDCAPIGVVHGVSTYTFVAPSNDVLIVQMDQLRIAGYDSPLDPIRREDADVQFPQWQTATGIVRYWLGTGPRTVQLINIPDADITGGLTGRAVVTPARGATGPDELFLTHFREEVAAGAKYRLMLQPKKPYTNPAEAVYFEEKFRSAVGKASVLKATGFSNVPIRTRSYAR